MNGHHFLISQSEGTNDDRSAFDKREGNQLEALRSFVRRIIPSFDDSV